MNRNTIEHLSESELNAYMKWRDRQQNGLSNREAAGEIVGGIILFIVAVAVIFA